MSKETYVKMTAVTLLLAAAVSSPGLLPGSGPRQMEMSMAGALLLFGLVNIFLASSASDKFGMPPSLG